ncbi:MAG: DNA translocase FtsK 4TM domain-containing protein [Rhodovarius sp.]|nr:DNA translocase FtsK [Rhodovarius sp.]MDW8315166.1 DNA translocase FtsK 4TM domain-containing protein [Rhodovarius sp.]
MARGEASGMAGEEGGRLASPALRAAMARSLRHLIGLIAALAGLALAIALLSYDPADPSGSTASGEAPRNLAGPAGAMLADLLLQAVGFAAFLPAFVLLAWALRLATGRAVTHLPLRLLALLAGLPVLAAGLAALPLPPEAPVLAGPGGAFGPLLHQALTGWIGAAFGPFGQMVGHGLLGLLCLLVLVGALGFAPSEWRRAARVTADATAGLARAGLARRHLARRLLAAPFRGVAWLFRRVRARRAEPGEDLRGLLRAAEAAAEAAPRRPPPPPPEPPGPAESEPAPAPRAPSRSPSRGSRPAPPAVPPEGPLLPPLDLLAEPPAQRSRGPDAETLSATARRLEQVLADFGVHGQITGIRPGPVVTLYELEPAPGTKSSRVIGLADDVARNMSVLAVRIATVPGSTVIGIELPNPRREVVLLREMLESPEWARSTARLPLALGKDIGGAPVLADLARMPHLLIAGTTGSGKSVGINTMILSLLYRFGPEAVRFIMIDPKMLELSVYDRIPHLLAPVVTEPAKAIGALKWTVKEMERRYRAMASINVRNIAGYNERVAAARQKGEVLTRRVQVGFDPETGKPVFEEQPLALEPLPMIVVVIDEMADLMIVAGKEIEAAVQRLAQMARAAGIHVIMATQRPSVDVITGTIKANFPSRISFMVTSKIDSRTILGEQGAEQLLGQGDMLFSAGGGRLQRVHGPFVSDEEVQRVADWLRAQGEPSYVEEVTEAAEEEAIALTSAGGGGEGEGALYQRAVELVLREGKCSISMVQRYLSVGYNKAAKLVEQMEREGVVGPANHQGKREVLARRALD